MQFFWWYNWRNDYINIKYRDAFNVERFVNVIFSIDIIDSNSHVNITISCHQFRVVYCLEFTTHEKLNRVKNIFKNCCSIWLSVEYCDEKIKNRKNFEIWYQMRSRLRRFSRLIIFKQFIDFNTKNRKIKK